MPTIVKMPKWGLTMTAGTVVDWLAAEGSEVTEGEPLLTVETEKAVDDVPAPADGILYRIVAGAGSEVPVSGPVAVILAAGEAISDEELQTLVQPVSAQDTASAMPGVSGPTRGARPATRDQAGRVNASPAARKRASELEVELQSVTATGPGGRITIDDVERAAAEQGQSAIDERDIPVATVGHVHALLAGPRKAEPIAFIHGLGGSLSSWQIVLGALAENWRLVAIDLPGHGQSGKPASADYSVSGLANAVGEVLQSTGISNAILAGHSLGGAVAMELARTRPDLVRGLVLIDSAALGTDISRHLMDLMSGEPGADTARGLLELFFEDKKLASPRAIEEMASHQTADGAWDAQRATAVAAFAGGRQSVPGPDDPAAVSQPVLVIWGERDGVIPVEHAYAATNVLADVQLAILPGIGHVPQVEAPERVATLIERFARSLG